MIQKSLAIGLIVSAAAAALHGEFRSADLRRQVVGSQQRQGNLEQQSEEIRQQLDGATRRLGALEQQGTQLQVALVELAKIRGQLKQLGTNMAQIEKARAAAQTDPVVESTLKPWAARVQLLKQKLTEMPTLQIPELALLKEQDWFEATKNADLDTEDGVREALKNLRNLAKIDFDHLLQNALRGHAQANNGQLPTDMAQLQPYFQTPVDNTLLQRYSLRQTGSLADAGAQALVAETAPPVDTEYDTVHQISIGGIMANNVHQSDDLVAAAAKAFAEANNGVLPHDPSQLTPYLQQPVDPVRAAKILGQIPPNATLQQLRAGQ
jgi:hypothetical protein